MCRNMGNAVHRCVLQASPVWTSSGGVQTHAGKGAGDYESINDLSSSSSLRGNEATVISREATEQLLEGSSSLVESEADTDYEMYQAGCSSSLLLHAYMSVYA